VVPVPVVVPEPGLRPRVELSLIVPAPEVPVPLAPVVPVPAAPEPDMLWFILVSELIAPPVVPAAPAAPDADDVAPTSPPLVAVALSRLPPLLHAPTASTAASASMLLPVVTLRMTPFSLIAA
jgi:hypothetical protein